MRAMNELMRQAVDGELSETEAAELLRDTSLADELHKTAELRAALRGLSAPKVRPGFSARVLARLPAKRSLFERVFEALATPRFTLRFSAGTLTAACAGLAVIALTLPRASAPAQQIQMAQAVQTPATLIPAAYAPSSDEVPVRFVVVQPDAKDVALAGDFNGWKTNALHLTPAAEPGLWTVTVKLPRGHHRYMFVVDGKRWETDPLAEEHHRDGFGHENAVLDL